MLRRALYVGLIAVGMAGFKTGEGVLNESKSLESMIQPVPAEVVRVNEIDDGMSWQSLKVEMYEAKKQEGFAVSNDYLSEIRDLTTERANLVNTPAYKEYHESLKSFSSESKTDYLTGFMLSLFSIIPILAGSVALTRDVQRHQKPKKD